jgi:peptidoglycan hydrolase-like protein with peptidoglycan-binding domain
MAQTWLNETYGYHPKYAYITNVNGLPGSAFSAALVSAMQIALAMDSDDITGVFGSITSAACDDLPLSQGDSGPRVKIMQCGLYGKGYFADALSGTFSLETLNSVQQIQEDAGLTGAQVADVAEGLQLQAILGVDEYKLVGNGDTAIRSIQQDLNHRYLPYTGLKACDGHYSRSTNEALILAFQAQEGMPPSMATGYFGSATTSYCPDIGTGETQWGMNGAYSNADLAAFIKLAQYALYCVGRTPYYNWSDDGSDYDPGSFSGGFDTGTMAALRRFQQDVGLPQRDFIGLDEWMALFVSTGNPNRDGLAADCATRLTTAAKATAVYNDEYRIVGRYLTGSLFLEDGTEVSKALTRSEAENILNCGLKLFVIYQDPTAYYEQHPSEDNEYNYFTWTQGQADAQLAAGAALEIGVPATEYIYFAVDYDFMQDEVYDKVVPYFQGLQSYASTEYFPYRIGIYSSRNTCGIVSKRGLATSSFVGDLSTGYSGNLGFPLPPNWAFDQVKEYPLWSADGTFDIDKDVTSGRYMGFDHLDDEGFATVASFDFKCSLTDETTTVYGISWRDSWFAEPASEYNPKLATAAMALSALAYSSVAQVSTGFQKLGFSNNDIETVEVGGTGPIGYTLAVKEISIDNTTENLIVVDVRGTASEDEWKSNMDMSGGAATATIHKGFDDAANNVYSGLMSWLAEKDISHSNGSGKILVTGHSRGAAAANLVAVRLIANNVFSANDVFGYTFATPNTKTSVNSYANIHNIVNPEDFVPRVPLVQWGFSKDGQTYDLPSVSTYDSLAYRQLYNRTNSYFNLLANDDYNNWPTGTGPVENFVTSVYSYASDVNTYYTLEYGQDPPVTTYDFFDLLASFLGTENPVYGAVLVTWLFGAFPGFVPYLSAEPLDHHIFHAHCQEIYLAWMQALEETDVLG